MTYAEKLKDPRWQRKRLEIMQRDDFTCRDCGQKDSTLHVHHCLYSSGKDPWDYEDRELRTLCVDCHNLRHDAEHDLNMEFKRMVALLDQSVMRRLMFECLYVQSIGATPFIVSDIDLSESAPNLKEWAENYLNHGP